MVISKIEAEKRWTEMKANLESVKQNLKATSDQQENLKQKRLTLIKQVAKLTGFIVNVKNSPLDTTTNATKQEELNPAGSTC